MNNSNQLKSINGYNNNMSTLQVLQELQQQGYIAYCKSEYRIGYPDFNADQFYAPFCIEFFNGAIWLIFSSTSIRNDRMNNQQWNSYHMRKLNPNITRAYLILPDEIVSNEKEYKQALSYNKKIDDHKMFSSLDATLTQRQLVDAVIRYSEMVKKTETEESSTVTEPLYSYGTSISGSKLK